MKPWGTNHAVLMGKEVINEPFAVINADDFMVATVLLYWEKELSAMTGQKNDYCMVGYRAGNTLSESGSVARGVCEQTRKAILQRLLGITAIERIDGKVSLLMRMVNWCRLQTTHRSL